jgi:DNA topoisomerase VI subunit B
MTTEAKLVRTTFRTSREMDFFSERELITQTGHDRGEWPLVICKELIDNAMDACEEAGVTPVIEVLCDAGGISVADNGPGIPESTLDGQLDFSVRVSSREAYVSPCRGAQGNALKTLLPMPYILDPENGKVIVEAHGYRHVIACGADPVSQRPAIRHDKRKLPKSKKLQVCHADPSHAREIAKASGRSSDRSKRRKRENLYACGYLSERRGSLSPKQRLAATYAWRAAAS